MNSIAKRRFIALFFSLFLLFSTLFPALPAVAADTIKPRLESITTSKSSYSNGEYIEFIIKFFDTSGVDINTLSMTANLTDSLNKYGTRVVMMEFISTDVTSQYYTSAQKLQGYEAYSCKVPVEHSFATGKYYITVLSITDKAQNQEYFQSSPPFNNLERITFDVINSARPDSIGPVLTSVSMDKTTVSVGETICFTVKAQDKDGLSEGNLRLIREGQSNWLNYDLKVKPGSSDTLEHFFTPSAETIPGIYTVYSLSVYDNATFSNGSYYSISADPDYFDSPALLPENFRLSFTVVNPNYVQNKVPQVTQVKFSKTTVLPGDTVNVEVTIDDGGTPIENYMFLRINRITDNNWAQIGGLNLYLAEDGKYKGIYRVPAVFQQRSLSVGYVIHHKDGYSTQYAALEDKTYLAPVLNIGSIFSGVDDTSIIIGSTFNPMSGVTAANSAEGNLSSKINLEGDVDTQTAGVYLLKYTIPSNLPFVQYQEENPNGVYFASRLVGVTETEPSGYESDEEEPLVIAEDSVFIGADPKEVIIAINGVQIEFTEELTREGVYEITDISAEQNSDSGLSSHKSEELNFTSMSVHKSYSTLMLNSSTSVSGKKSNIVLIDRSAPDISITTSKISSELLSVRIRVKDLSPITKIQYLLGTHESENVRKSGVTIKNDFKLQAAAGDSISVLATDSLGHTAFKVFAVSQFSTTDSEGSQTSSDLNGSDDISSEENAAMSTNSSDDQSSISFNQTGDENSDSKSIESETKSDNNSRSSTLIIILLLIAVFVIAGGIGTGIYFYKRLARRDGSCGS